MALPFAVILPWRFDKNTLSWQQLIAHSKFKHRLNARHLGCSNLNNADSLGDDYYLFHARVPATSCCDQRHLQVK